MTFFDSSAVLALLLREAGADFMAERLDGAELSIVNYAEVLANAADSGGQIAAAAAAVDELGLWIRAFREAHALEAARLRPLTRHLGRSFGDRACLALARVAELPVLTADRDWAKLDLGIDVHLIR